MKRTSEIATLYCPVQPGVQESDDRITYTEFLPDFRLKSFIHCYWQLKTTRQLSDHFNYRVVCDGCMDIFFDIHHPEESYVMGFSKKFAEFSFHEAFNYVGVRFLPAMFTQLFRINAQELSNRCEHLQHVLPGLSDYIAHHFNDAQPQNQVKFLLDRYFLQHASGLTFEYDGRLHEAITRVLKNSGVLDIEKDLDTGISARQLRRLFEYHVGATPKTFSKVVRFQNLLKSSPSSQGLRENKTFLELGYYDQSHFIKDFKDLFGTTPGDAFAR